MAITKNYNQPFVIFLLMGVPYLVPGGWCKSDGLSVNNDIQQTVNPKYEPAIRFSSANFNVEFHIPSGLDLIHHATARLLRTALISLSEALSGEQYANINYEEQIPVDAVGRVVMPWHRLRAPEQQKTMRGDILPTMTAFLGHANHVLSGYLQTVYPRYIPDTGMEVWTIGIQKLNMASLRREPPKHDGVPDPNSAMDGGGRSFDITSLKPQP